MAGVNKVIIVGNLGRSPELRYTADGTAVATMSVATSLDWKDKNTGEKKQKTEWHRIIVFRGAAEACAKHLAKGRQVYVEGRLQTRQWEKDGQTHYITEIVANNVQFLGTRDGQRNDPPVDDDTYGPIPAGPVLTDQDDIPF